MSKVDVSSENGGCGCDSVRNACRCLRTDVYVWLLTATALALVCCRILAFLLRCKFSFFRGCCKPRCIEPESPSSKVCVLKLEKTLLQRLRPPSGQSHADLNSRHPQSATGLSAVCMCVSSNLTHPSPANARLHMAAPYLALGVLPGRRTQKAQLHLVRLAVQPDPSQKRPQLTC